MAVSFFAFIALLSVADLSFAVPATAASYVLETVLAKYLLKEPVTPGALGGRIAGSLRRGAAVAVIWLAVPALASAAYWLLVHRGRDPVAQTAYRSEPRGDQPLPAVSILKPVHGRDPHFYEAIRSHAVQDYPAIRNPVRHRRAPDDPAAEDIRRLIAEFPERDIRLIVTSTKMPNAKVGVLADLAAAGPLPAPADQR